MAIQIQNEQTRALYVYCPEHLHNWLDELKAETDVSKSELSIVLLEVCKKYLDDDNIKKILQDWVLWGEDGIDLSGLPSFKERICQTPS